MKQIALFFISQIVTIYSIGQVDFTKTYYPYVNRAELAIVDEKYDDALLSYDTAFRHTAKPLAKDYLNALICALKTQAIPLAYRYSDSLIAKGVKKDFFENHGGFKILWETPEWEAFVKSFEKKYELLNKNRDTTTNSLFRKLFDTDQEFRRKKGAYTAYRDTIDKIDSNNIVQLKHVIKTIGFPNENMVGISDPTSVFFPAYVVFHHYCQSLSLKKTGKDDFIKEFFDAVKKGELEPHRFAHLLSLQNNRSVRLGGWGVVKAAFGGEESKLLGDKYPLAERVLMNKTRILYGLETLEEYYKKVIFSIRDPRAKEFAFRIFDFVNIFEFGDEEQYKKFIAASEIIE